MKITYILADSNQAQSLKTLSNKEASEIVGGDRNRSGDPAPRFRKRLDYDYIVNQVLTLNQPLLESLRTLTLLN